MDFFDLQNKFQLLAGHVQCGKTRHILDYCSWSNDQGSSALVVLQNSLADIVQLCMRIESYNIDKPRKLRPAIVSEMTVYDPDDHRVYIIIGNSSQVKLFLGWDPKNYHVCLDEADMCIKSCNISSKLEASMVRLKTRCSHVLAVTATCLPVLFCEERLTSVKTLDNPDNYYGYETLAKIALGRDPVAEAYDDFCKEPTGLMLHVQHSAKYKQRRSVSDLIKVYPQVLFVVFNGDGLTIYPHPLRHKIIKTVKKQTGFSAKRTVEDVPVVVDKVQCNLYKLLQIIKKRKVALTSIVAGRMASRGISFVSEKYDFHLTHQLLLCPASKHAEGIVQSLRILGVYRDSPQLKLYAEPRIFKIIERTYEAFESYTRQIESKTWDFSAISEVVKQIEVPHIGAFSRPNVIKFLEFNVKAPEGSTSKTMQFTGLSEYAPEPEPEAADADESA